MRILITGANGQLAGDLIPAFAGEEVVALTRAELDITRPDQTDAAFDRHRPDVVINTAAFHEVDRCESEPEASFAVNAAAPQRLAVTCREHGALLVQLSTDYVFNGERCTPYPEDFPVDPLSVYGASRVAGEMAVRATTPEHLIVRTTGLYGRAGIGRARGNFVETMLRLAERGGTIRVVADQVLTPSSTRDVARAIVALVCAGARGTVHVTNAGACSWFEFAGAIFRLAELSVALLPTTRAERPTAARRPAYSVLAHDGLRRWGVAELPPWEEALAGYLQERTREASSPHP